MSDLELREAIAREVMGMRVTEFCNDFRGTPSFRVVIDDGRTRTPWNNPHCLHYESDIAAAWLVVEKMRGKPREWEVNIYSYASGYRCWFTAGEHGLPANVAPTAPEAICRAALAAIRSQG